MSANIVFLDNDGKTQVTLENLSDAFAGQNQTPRKVAFQSLSNRPLNNVTIAPGTVAGNDGVGELRLALDTATLSCPYGFAAAVSAGGAGGTFAGAGTYGYVITATNANGESAPCAEVDANITDPTSKVTLTWTQTPGATGYKIYRTATPGTFTSPTLIATIGSGATVSFLDGGAAASAGVPPSVNLTAGWILSAVLSAPAAGGVWAGTGPEFWTVIAYDSTGVEIAHSTQATVNVDNTTKTVALSWASAALAGAASIKVYRSTVTGVYTSPALVATLAGSATGYTDTGTAVVAGGFTTGQSYGIPPSTASFGTAALTTGSSVAIGQQIFFWVNRVVPGGTPETGNPRQANIVVQEN